MVCNECRDMLQSQKGRTWKGTYDLRYRLDVTVITLEQRSAGCVICRSLCEGLKEHLKNTASSGSGRRDSSPAAPQADTSTDCQSLAAISKRSLEIAASLYFHQDNFGTKGKEETAKHLYRLDVVLQEPSKDREQVHSSGSVQVKRTFFLENPKTEVAGLISSASPRTSSKEVFDTIMGWMQQCKCTVDGPPTFYPARLISLKALKGEFRSFEASREATSARPDVQVKLVDTKGWLLKNRTKSPSAPRENDKYVTLSHCWGSGAVKPEHRLTYLTEQGLRRGISVDKLPKTFQEAIFFAALIKGVGYIWIDSLCIRQKPEGEEEGAEVAAAQRDWLHQSADMDLVYSATYLNISATASDSSAGGLFRNRDPAMLKAESVMLNIEGLPGVYIPDTEKMSTNAIGSVEVRARDTGKDPNLYRRECTVLDPTFWTDRVDKAPVNKRGWVVQERILSPRVLHFCEDQVAWECLGSNGCKGFDFAEGQPLGLSNFQLTERGIVEALRLKAVHFEHSLSRPQESQSPIDQSNDNAVHSSSAQERALKEWARIIETYSKTSLTNPEDKLIALSGMAKNMFKEIYSGQRSTGSQYVAGLWGIRLESQLLWYVEPLFDPIKNTFSNPARSPEEWSTRGSKKYRSPSFSWAAIDNPDRGIVYGDTTLRKLFIEVEENGVTLKTDPKSAFGLLHDASITLRCKLRKAIIQKQKTGTARYIWHLDHRDEANADLDEEPHTNVYLDCFERDEKACVNPHGRRKKKVYVVPAAINHGGEMVCLILRLVDTEQALYRRVGLTKLSPFMDKLAMQGEQGAQGAKHKILQVLDGDIKEPHKGYEGGMHRIHLI
ncbi:HET-domain-containing protein [Aaosphaeria arxii CBS 175.79]|uniref:HET-domain-containing protein n=1 Tax=Aaosphaeria arxii CBS 175.79 TaxID=1450172 RepID=A0A6A5XRD7_9PLEO|nr:HET-domain-containing protein [Aaosphaeria arxii CBS 175.79]KAF2014864.1 HET-domain-containing protein [Aaosphaeria arxii CBS 175.79]